MGEAAPPGWREVRLGEILVEQDERVGARIDLSPLSLTKAEGLVPARERFGKDLLGKDLSRYRVCRRDDFVVDPMLLWDGAVARLTRFKAGFVSPDYRVYRATEEVHAPFVSYLLSGPAAREAFANNAKGTNIRRNRISREDFGNVRLHCPPRSVQERISNLLSAVEVAADMAASVLSNANKVRDILLDRVMLKPSTPPKLHPVVPLDSVLLSATYGVSLALAASQEPLDWAVLRMSNIQNDELDLSDLKYADLAVFDEADIGLQVGDILFNRTNSLELVGKVAIVRENLPRVSFASYLVRLRVDPRLAAPEWVHLYMASPDFQRRLHKLSTPGVSQANINPTAMRQLLVVLPPLPEQVRTVKVFDEVRQAIERSREHYKRLRSLKHALQQSLLSGRLRVKV